MDSWSDSSSNTGIDNGAFDDTGCSGKKPNSKRSHWACAESSDSCWLDGESASWSHKKLMKDATGVEYSNIQGIKFNNERKRLMERMDDDDENTCRRKRYKPSAEKLASQYNKVALALFAQNSAATSNKKQQESQFDKSIVKQPENAPVFSSRKMNASTCHPSQVEHDEGCDHPAIRVQDFDMDLYEKRYGKFAVHPLPVAPLQDSIQATERRNFEEEVDQHFRYYCGSRSSFTIPSFMSSSSTQKNFTEDDSNGEDVTSDDCLKDINALFSKMDCDDGKREVDCDILQQPSIPSLDVSSFGLQTPANRALQPTTKEGNGVAQPLFREQTKALSRAGLQEKQVSIDQTRDHVKEEPQGEVPQLQMQQQGKTKQYRVAEDIKQKMPSAASTFQTQGNKSSLDGTNLHKHPIPSISLKRHHPQMNKRNHLFNGNCKTDSVGTSNKIGIFGFIMPSSSSSKAVDGGSLSSSSCGSTSTTYDSDSLSTVPEYNTLEDTDSISSCDEECSFL